MSLADRSFEAVIFDLDNTLVYSMDTIDRSWRQFAVEYGKTEEQFPLHDWHGIPARAIMPLLAPDETAEKHEEMFHRIREIEIADAVSVTALPGALETLAALDGIPWAIATSGTHDLATARMAGAGIPMPEVLVTADDVENGKPAPDCFLLAAQRLGVDPTNTIVAEDAVAGITAATAAGCASVAVLTSTPAERLQADLVVPDLSHIDWRVSAGRVSVHRRD